MRLLAGCVFVFKWDWDCPVPRAQSQFGVLIPFLVALLFPVSIYTSQSNHSSHFDYQPILISRIKRERELTLGSGWSVVVQRRLQWEIAKMSRLGSAEVVKMSICEGNFRRS
jgi:hypothetical protein